MSAQPTREPFYRTPDFAIILTLVSLSAASILTVLGVRLKNLSFLFLLAWCIAVPAGIVLYIYFRRFWAIIVSVVVLLVFASGLRWLDRKTQAQNSANEPIEISPDNVTFRQVVIGNGTGPVPKLFSQQYSFRITNMTERDVYSIGAKLNIESTSLTLADFALGIPKSSWKPLDESQASTGQSGDIMALGCKDKRNHFLFVIELAHLGPHESREVTIKESDSKAENEATATIRAKVFHSTFESLPLLKNGNSAMFMPMVPFDETLDIESMTLIPHLP